MTYMMGRFYTPYRMDGQVIGHTGANVLYYAHLSRFLLHLSVALFLISTLLITHNLAGSAACYVFKSKSFITLSNLSGYVASMCLNQNSL